MNIVLDFKKNNGSSTFYRYAVDQEMKVWFSQENDTGNIYSVGVKLPARVASEFEIVVRDGSENDNFYPENVDVHIHAKLDRMRMTSFIASARYVQDAGFVNE